MLIGDDDDYEGMLEEADDDDYDEAPAVESQPSSAEETIEAADVKREDFELLPFVAALVEAHKSGSKEDAEAKYAALKKAIRRAEKCFEVLQAATSGLEDPADPADTEALVKAQTNLLSRCGKRKERAGDG